MIDNLDLNVPAGTFTFEVRDSYLVAVNQEGVEVGRSRPLTDDELATLAPSPPPVSVMFLE